MLVLANYVGMESHSESSVNVQTMVTMQMEICNIL